MASTEAKAQFITTLRVHYTVAIYEPNREAKELAWARSIADCIDFYSDDVVARATQKILHTRTSDRRFPLPAEIRKVCDLIVADDRRSTELPSVDTGRPVQHVHKRALALDMLRTQQGREAAADGWVLALYEFIAEQGRAPTNQERHSFKTLEKGLDGRVRWTTHRCTEVEWLKMSSKGAQEAYEATIKGGFPFAALWARMGDDRSARRERLAEHALGKIDLRGRAEI